MRYLRDLAEYLLEDYLHDFSAELIEDREVPENWRDTLSDSEYRKSLMREAFNKSAKWLDPYPGYLKTQAAKSLGVDVEDIEWWSWPVSFSSTAGASGGAGGQMMSGGQCFGFMARAVTDKAIKTCDGKRWKRWSGEPGENW